MHVKKLCLFISFVLVSSSLCAQTVIKGTVINGKTGKSLPGANVYLAQTTIGQSTNRLGIYQIKTDIKGKFNLVFSFVGFKKKVVQVVLGTKDTIEVNAALQPKAIQMDKLTVTGSNNRWKEGLHFFIDQFIGTTRFAEKTEILNPQVLRFHRNSNGEFVAKARKPLQIVNRALGYRIYVELQQFKWNRNRERGFYKIYAKYEPIQPVSENQLEDWQENRRGTYMGSMRHFLKKLYYDEASDEFSISPQGNLELLPESKTTFKLLGRVPSKLAHSLKGFKLYDPIVVIYGEANNAGGLGFGSSEQKKSAMAATTNNLIFFIDKHGLLLNPLSIITGGYWSEKRLANSLPLDYRFDE